MGVGPQHWSDARDVGRPLRVDDAAAGQEDRAVDPRAIGVQDVRPRPALSQPLPQGGGGTECAAGATAVKAAFASVDSSARMTSRHSFLKVLAYSADSSRPGGTSRAGSSSGLLEAAAPAERAAGLSEPGGSRIKQTVGGGGARF